MTKKATVKDVAREAGVSVATVSYIMNNRTDMKISDATRKKVLQIANLLDYIPSHAAKSLATGRNNIIGVSYHLNPNTPSRNLEITGFVNLLIEQLNRLKYDVLFMPVNAANDNIPLNRNIDGIIAIDLSGEEFHELSNNYLVPIISIDMIIKDSLFYQIYSDIPALIDKAKEKLGEDFYIVTDHIVNENYSELVLDGVPKDHVLFFSNTIPDALKSLEGKKVLVIGSYLALVILPYVNVSNSVVISSNMLDVPLPKETTIIKKDISKKANLAINIMMNALDKKFDLDHIYAI